MKKSFLNRAMAAAIAVPVALSQTVLFASFADDTVPNSKSVTVDTFLNVPVEDAPTHPIVEVEKYHIYEIESTWYNRVRSALNSVDGEAAKNFDITSLVDQSGKYADKWYADFVKAATTATAQVVGTDVIINFNVNVNEDAQAIIKEKVVNTILGENSSLEEDVVNRFITTDVPAASYGTVTLTVHTDKLEETQGVTFDVKAVTDAGTITTLEGLEAYADSKIAAYEKELRADAEKIVSYYQGLSQQQLDDAIYLRDTAIDKMVNHYNDLKDKAFNKADNAIDKTRTVSYEKANYNEVLAAAKEAADNRTSDTSKAGKLVNKIPDTISEAVSNSTVLKIYTEALRQLNSFAGANGYTVDISLDELGSTLEAAYNVTVDAKNAGNGEVWGQTTAFMADDLDDLSYYYTYFNELLEKDGVTDKEVDTITTEKKVEAEGNAHYASLDGDGTLHVKRIITITLKDKEEETSESTEDTTESTEDTSESTEDTTESTEDTQDSTEDTQDSTEDTQDSTEDTQDSTEDTQDSTEDTTEPDTVPGVRVDDIAFEVDGDVAGNRNFYFSHDPRPLADDVAALIKKATYTTEDMTTKEISLQGNFAFGLTNDLEDPTTVSPKSIFDELTENGEPAAYSYKPLYIYFKNQNGVWEVTKEPLVYIYIGVKGDANLDGICNAKDGAAVLVYAADFGAGNEARLTDKTAIGTDLPLAAEAFAWFLADVNEESKDMGTTTNRPDDNGIYEGGAVLNSKDAAAIFVYAADFGAGNNPDWGDELVKPLPRFTAEIYKWKQEHPESETQPQNAE